MKHSLSRLRYVSTVLLVSASLSTSSSLLTAQDAPLFLQSPVAVGGQRNSLHSNAMDSYTFWVSNSGRCADRICPASPRIRSLSPAGSMG